MFCGYCGSQLTDDSLFCPDCGKSTTDFPTSNSSSQHTPHMYYNTYVQPNIPVMTCPHCGSTHLQVISDVNGKGVSLLRLCFCGLWGLCGAGKTKTTHYWVCQTCGNRFKI